MPALGTFTGLPSANDLVRSELIERYIYEYNYPLTVGELVSHRKITTSGNTPVQFPRWDAITTPTTAKAETDQFSDVSITTSAETITPALYGMRLPISDEIMAGAVGGIPAGAIDQAIMSMKDLIDISTLAVSGSATLTTGADTDTMTEAHFRSGLSYLRSNTNFSGLGQVAFVCSETQLTNLESDLISNDVEFYKDSGSLQKFGPTLGYKGVLHGVHVFASANVAASGTGSSAFFTPMGERSGIGLAVQEMPNVVTTRGDDAENRAVTYVHGRFWAGFGVVNPNNLVELIA